MSTEGTVLIVDPEPLAVELVERRLEEAGFATRSSSRMEEGIALAGSEPFDVVLVSHRLPDGTGLEMVQRLRRDPRTAAISIALLTSLPDPEEITRVLEAGADEVLRKPVHRVELVARVRSLRRIKRQLEELRRTNTRLAELNAALEASAMTDGLTQLANRRHLDRRLAEEVARANRYGAPLSVLLLDVDHFKKVNDGHGHSAGDAVLREIARELRSSVRIMDLAARYGGEELLVLAPSTPSHAAHVFAERLRAQIEHLAIDAPGAERALRVTVSIGVAQLAPGHDGASVLAAADEALYEAKRSGRNRVVVARSAPADPPEDPRGTALPLDSVLAHLPV